MSEAIQRTSQPVVGNAIGAIQLRSHGVAILCVAIALGATLLLLPWLYPTTTPLFLLAVMVSAWYGNWQAGLLATVLSILAISYFFVEPFYSLNILNSNNAIWLSVFLLVAGAVSWLNQSRRAALENAQEHLQALQIAINREQSVVFEAKTAKEQLETVLSSINDGFYILDRNWRFTYVNDRYCEIVSMQPSELLGQNIWQLFPAAVDTEAYIQFHRAIDEQIPLQFDYLYAPWNCWHDHRIYPSPTGLTVLISDISDRKQSEATTRQSEARLRAVAANLPNGAAFIVDRDLRYQLAEGKALENAGITAETLVGKTLWEAFDSSLADRYAPYYNQALAGKPFSLEHHSHNRDYISHGMPLYDDRGEIEAVLVVSYDISDRVRAEVELQASETRFRDLADNAPITIWVTDATGYCTYLSRTWYDFSGQTEATGLGYGWLDVIHPDDRQAAKAIFVAANKRQEAFQIEYRLRRQDGEYRTCIDAARPWFGANGEFKGFIGSAIDIEDRKRAEAALRQSEERYRTLFESIDEGFCIVEILFDQTDKPIDYLFLEVNPSFEQQTGLQQAAGKTARQLVPDLEDRWVQTYAQVALTGEPVRFENAAEAMNRWFDVYACRFGQPEARKVAIVFKEVSDRKIAERKVQASNNRLKLLAETANDLLLTTDPKAFLASLFAKVSAHLQLEIYINYLFYADQKHLELHAHGGITPELAQAARHLALGQAVCGYVVQHRSPVVVEDALSTDNPLAVPVKSAGIRAYASHPLMVGDRVMGTLGLGTRSRDRFTQDELDLMQAVAAQVAAALERSRLIKELQERAEALDRANQIKDEFLAVLSHELRTPLNPILGWSKLLQQKKLDAAKTTTALATIERNAQLQAQLIEDLLDISRILRGKLLLNQTPVDLKTVILSALETVGLAAEAKSQQIQTSLSADVGLVIGDAGRLQQVVWNLLSNAVKFTPHGGQITIKLTQTTTHAQIQISDTGKGIAPDFLPYVFEHFRQEDGAITRKFGGLGLGLAIVRQIVELHGGTVAVKSQGESQGATFIVAIPLGLAVSDVAALETPIDSTSDLSGIQILVVDDEPDSREFVAFVLEQANAIVTSVGSGFEALQAIEQSVPDLIVSDIGMPNLDGYMLMRQVRAMELAKHVPAIALTAYAGESDRSLAIASGFQTHLAKPIEPTEIVKIAAHLCKQDSRNAAIDFS